MRMNLKEIIRNTPMKYTQLLGLGASGQISFVMSDSQFCVGEPENIVIEQKLIGNRKYLAV